MQGAKARQETAGAAENGCHHHHHGHHHQREQGAGWGAGAGWQGERGAAPRSLLPSAGSVVQAGAFGAALGGMTTGVVEMARVRQGAITTEEATRNVVKSSAQGAATMAVASVAGQLVRSHPMFSFIALAAAGIGAFAILSGAGGEKGAAVPAAAPTAPRSKTGKSGTAPKQPA
ncbi:MAG: hypothetical protein U1E66_07340 [Rhodospirillales bacterium]